MPVAAASNTLPSSSKAISGSESRLRGWHGTHKCSCKLMKKHVELARRGCKLLQHTTLCDSAKPANLGSAWQQPAWARSTSADLNSGHRRSVHSQQVSGGNEQWRYRADNAAFRRREAEEHARSRQKPPGNQHRRSRSSSTGFQAVNSRSPASIYAPNHPAEARRRAAPIDPAHPSHQYAAPAANVAQHTAPSWQLPLARQAPRESPTATHAAFTEARPAQHDTEQPTLDESAAEVENLVQQATEALAQLVMCCSATLPLTNPPTCSSTRHLPEACCILQAVST